MDETPIPEYKPKGHRISLKDILSKGTVETLEKIAKNAKSQAKADSIKGSRGKGGGGSGPLFNVDFDNLEVEIKNDKGNPLPVKFSTDSLSFSDKLSEKIDNVGALIGQNKFEIDDKRLFDDLGNVKKNLELIYSSLELNKDAINKSGQGDKSTALLERMESTLKELTSAIKTGDLKKAQQAAETSIKDSKEASDIADKVEGGLLSVSQAFEATNNILNSHSTSLQSQKDAANNMITILNESKYSNKSHLQELKKAIVDGDTAQLRAAMKSISQNKENFSKELIDSRRSLKALEGIENLNTEMKAQLEHQSIQQMFADKYKKTSAFGQSNMAKGAGGILSSMLGIPGAELLAGPAMDIANLVGGKNIMKGLGKLNPFTKGGKGPLGLGMKYGSKAMKIGGAVGGLMSAGATGYEEYNKYQDAKANGASEEELSKIKTTGIAKTVGSGVGGAAGAALGSLLGPLGTMAGGYLGSMAGEWLGEKGGDWLNEQGGIDKLVDSVVGFFKDIGKSISDTFNSAISTAKSIFTSIKNGISGLFSETGIFGSIKNFLKAIFDASPIGLIVNNFDAIKNGLSSLFGEGGMFGSLSAFLKTILESSPVEKIISSFESMTEGISNLFGEEGIFGKAQEYIDKILDSAPIKALMTVFSGGSSVGSSLLDLSKGSNSTADQNDLPKTGESPQRSVPTVSKREMDVRSSDLSKKELEAQRDFRKESSKSSAPQVSIPPAAAPQPQAAMNSKPSIDDYGLAFMNSAVFE